MEPEGERERERESGSTVGAKKQENLRLQLISLLAAMAASESQQNFLLL